MTATRSSLNTTAWFPETITPIRRGVYEVRDGDKCCYGYWGGWFSYWDGKKFGWRDSAGPAYAYQNRDATTCLPPRCQWRGLAKQPTVRIKERGLTMPYRGKLRG